MRESGVVLAFLAAILCSAAQGQNCRLDEVLSRFPGFHVLKLEERDSETRAFLNQFAKGNPSVVHADFDGDGRPDFALLLRSAGGKARFVIVLCPESQELKTVHDLDVTGSDGGAYLKPVPAGTLVSQTEAIDSGTRVPRVRLTSPGIRVVYFEKAEVLLYWSPQLHKIREIQTGD